MSGPLLSPARRLWQAAHQNTRYGAKRVFHAKGVKKWKSISQKKKKFSGAESEKELDRSPGVAIYC